LVLLMLAGALIRHSFVSRHKAHVLGQRTPWEHAVVGSLALAGMALWLAPPPRSEATLAAAQQPAGFKQVQAIVEQRCTLCHNAQLQNKNVALHTAELIKVNAQGIYQQAVVQKSMPLNNATQITDAERDVLKRWFEGGAQAQ
jgi:uncharacterized membrane protein